MKSKSLIERIKKDPATYSDFHFTVKHILKDDYEKWLNDKIEITFEQFGSPVIDKKVLMEEKKEMIEKLGGEMEYKKLKWIDKLLEQ